MTELDLRSAAPEFVPRPSGITRRRFLQAAGIGGAALASGFLSGCSPADGREPLQFWQFYAPTSQTQPDLKAQNDWFLGAIKDWNKRDDRQIEAVFIPAYSTPANTRLSTAFASNSGPDIFLISPGDFLRYANGGVLEDLTPYMEKSVIADFVPGALDTRTIDGHIYAIPMELEPLAIFYSRPAWESVGLSEGDIPKTWEQLLEIAAKLETPKRSGLVFETGPGYYQNFTWYPWLWQGGGEVVDPKTQRAAFDSDAAIQALELFGDSIRRGVSPRTLPAAGDTAGAFAEDFAGMWQNGIWQVANFRANQPDFDYGVFPLPAPAGGKSTTVLGGWSWCVNRNGKDPEGAAKFVVETVASSSPECIDRLANWCAVAKSDMAPRISVENRMEEMGAFENPRLRIFRDEVLPTGRGEPRYPPVVYKAVSNAIQSVQMAGGNATDQVGVANGAVDAFLETYEGGSLI